jgi:hypothetical protein
MSNPLRDQILAADDLPRKEVKIPEWKTTVWVRTLTAGERDRFEGRQARDPYTDVRARLAVLCLVDESGANIFSEQDIPALSQKCSKALDRIFAISVQLNGISKQDLEELKKG